MEYKIEFSGRAINYSDDEIRIINEVAKNADPLTQGPYLQNFEQNIKKYLGVNHAFGLTNGASALELAAVLCKLKKGDEVIIPSHTYCATAIPFGRTGAKIVWADIDPETFVISESDIKKKVTNNTKVIVLVHLYGQACDMSPILKICADNNIKLVEDCAQSIGAKYKNKYVGSFGDFACFSLHAQKNITTLGEGGFLIVKDKLDASKVKGLRHNGHTSFGERDEYWKPAMTNVDLDIDGVWPFNYSMTEIQAALGSKLLERLEDLNRQRIARANIFIDEMSEYTELTFQNPEDEYENVRHLLPAKYDGSQYGKCSHDLISLLSKKYKIKTIVQYYPLNRYPLFEKMGFGHAKCPNSDDFFDNMISFPFHHWMSEKDFLYLIDSVKLSLNALRHS